MLTEFGSAAPPTIHASRWLPIITTSSWLVPLMIPIEFQIGVVASLITLLSDILAPGLGPVLYVVLSLPSHPLRLTAAPAVPYPSSALRSGTASNHDTGSEGMRGTDWLLSALGESFLDG